MKEDCLMFANIAILIPAYEPDDHLLRLVAEIKQQKNLNSLPLIVVDDGTKDQKIFDQLQSSFGSSVIILHHAQNQGKGAALKTGFRYIINQLSEVIGIATLDADGQHKVVDLEKCLKAFKPGQLVLGVREFDQKGVPWPSRFGNQLTSFLVEKTTGSDFQDTQTGLRVIPVSYAKKCLDFPANDYAFEFDMLLSAKDSGLTIRQVSINTVYEKGNPTSHFHIFRDSFKIYWRFAKFALSSASSAVLDLTAFVLLARFIFPTSKQAVWAVLMARILSGGYNYLVNRHLVFAQKGQHTFLKYFILAILQAVLAGCLTEGLSWIFNAGLGLETTLKIAVDLFLFVLSYHVQKRWIFNEN